MGNRRQVDRDVHWNFEVENAGIFLGRHLQAFKPMLAVNDTERTNCRRIKFNRVVLFVVWDVFISGQENRSRKEGVLAVLPLYDVVG